jgi:hypothetical protein
MDCNSTFEPEIKQEVMGRSDRLLSFDTVMVQLSTKTIY